MAHIQKANRHGRFARTHRVMVSNRQQRNIGRVQLADQFHVSEKRRIARVIHSEPARQPDDIAASLAAIDDLRRHP